MHPQRKLSRSLGSWRNLGPDGLPVQNLTVDSQGNPVEEVQKGHKVSKDTYVVVPPESLELIADAQKTTVAEPRQYAPLDSIPLSTATMTYTVTPDPEVAASDEAVHILWNGLRAGKLAYVSQMSLRSGGRDDIVVFYATDEGLFAATLPFVNELIEAPLTEVKKDAKAAKVFAKFVEMSDEVDTATFIHASFESEAKKRRDKAIEAALSGQPIEAPKEAEAPTEPEGPSLMAMMEASIEEQAKTKNPAKKAAKKTSRKKVAA
jgi:non-homologous end joining protein Ku